MVRSARQCVESVEREVRWIEPGTFDGTTSEGGARRQVCESETYPPQHHYILDPDRLLMECVIVTDTGRSQLIVTSAIRPLHSQSCPERHRHGSQLSPEVLLFDSRLLTVENQHIFPTSICANIRHCLAVCRD